MHMSRTVVQIPVTTDLRDSAYAMAISQGFSSLQEAMRVILHKFASGALHVGVYTEPAPIQLSAKAIKRYDQMTKDFENGKNYTVTNSVEELMQQLGYENKKAQKVHQKLSSKNLGKSKIDKKVRESSETAPVFSE
jgi:hypothetical protein